MNVAKWRDRAGRGIGSDYTAMERSTVLIGWDSLRSSLSQKGERSFRCAGGSPARSVFVMIMVKLSASWRSGRPR
jgi:hypothetical protein